MLYSEKLKSLREKNGIKQSILAEKIKVGNKAYSHYENEKYIIPINHLNLLCNYFNVSLDFIFGFTNENNYKIKNKEIDLVIAGELLKAFRKENKITQDALAKILNVDRSTISKYEKGIHIIATPFLYTICKKYGVSADYLLGRVDEPKYYKNNAS